MEHKPEQPIDGSVEQEPQTYRIVLRRNFHEQTDDPFVEIGEEPKASDIMFEGSGKLDGASLWEEAGLTDPGEEDKYEIQTKDDDGSWVFTGVFATSEELEWVLETAHTEDLPVS